MRCLYYPFAESLLLGTAGNVTQYDIRALLVDSSYVFTQSHSNLSDVPVGARVHVTTTLQNITGTNGKLATDNFEIDTLTGDPVTQIIFYKHTGVEGTSSLLSYSNSSEGLPHTPVGEGLTIFFGTDGILNLGKVL